jgi:hypothetical protein
MAWYWQAVVGVISFDAVFVLAALLRSALLDRAERGTSGDREGRYLVEGLARQFLESPWPTFAPRGGGQCPTPYHLSQTAPPI